MKRSELFANINEFKAKKAKKKVSKSKKIKYKRKKNV